MKISSKGKFSRALMSMALVVSLGVSVSLPGFAAEPVTKNPIVKQGLWGAAIGGAAGWLSPESSVLKGVGVGALTGAGTGLVDTSSTMKRHPVVKSTAKGAIIGTGASTVAGKNKLSGAGIGAGVGAGYHFLKDLFND